MLCRFDETVDLIGLREVLFDFELERAKSSVGF
jgi:hypothetical protein